MIGALVVVTTIYAVVTIAMTVLKTGDEMIIPLIAGYIVIGIMLGIGSSITGSDWPYYLTLPREVALSFVLGAILGPLTFTLYLVGFIPYIIMCVVLNDWKQVPDFFWWHPIVHKLRVIIMLEYVYENLWWEEMVLTIVAILNIDYTQAKALLKEYLRKHPTVNKKNVKAAMVAAWIERNG